MILLIPQFWPYRKSHWLENAACGQPIRIRKNIAKQAIKKIIKNWSQTVSHIHQIKEASQMRFRNNYLRTLVKKA